MDQKRDVSQERANGHGHEVPVAGAWFREIVALRGQGYRQRCWELLCAAAPPWGSLPRQLPVSSTLPPKPTVSCDRSAPGPNHSPLELGERDRKGLLGIARRFLGCDHLAEDALQEALLALSLQQHPPDQPLLWLRGAILNRSRHLRRTLMRRRHHEHVAGQHCHLHGDCDNPLHVAMAHELGECLTRARAGLREEQRVALDLFERMRLDYQEIADRLKVPIGTVRSRISRARAQLQAAGRAWHGDSPGEATP